MGRILFTAKKATEQQKKYAGRGVGVWVKRSSPLGGEEEEPVGRGINKLAHLSSERSGGMALPLCERVCV